MKFAKSFSLRLVNRPFKRFQLSRNRQRCGEADSYSHFEQHVLDTKKVENSLHLTYISKRQFGKRENLQMFKKEEKITMIFSSSFFFFLFQLQPSSLRLLCFFLKTKHLAHDWLCGGSNLFQVYRPIGYGLLVSVRLAWANLFFLSEFFFR